MKEFCPFLQPELHSRSLRCTAGINFAAVGSNRERCNSCSFGNQGELPLCPEIEVYTFLDGSLNGGSVVRARYICMAEAGVLEAPCATCPQWIEKRRHKSGRLFSPIGQEAGASAE
jgi:hypothetical protein